MKSSIENQSGGPPIPEGSSQRIADGRRSIGPRELIVLLAVLMSMVALAVDIMLPAFADIRGEFGLAPDSTEAAGIITAFFIGLAVTQLVFGLAADRFGRRPMLYAGLAIYVVGTVISMLAPSLGWLLVGRFIWGAGAASPRVLTLSILRDVYSGERMARAMSFVMAIFILIPVVAPSLGAVLTDWISWRGAVGFTLVVATALGLWILRLPETLHSENQIRLTVPDIATAAKTVVTNRSTMAYTLMYTVLFGVFASYLASSELILADVFDLGDEFPVIFGALSLVMGVAVFVNGSLVGRVGLFRLINIVLLAYIVLAGAMTALAVVSGGSPPFWSFALVLSAVLAAHALLIPNLNTAAMIPMAPVAGTASAIIGTIGTAVGAVIGAFIDRIFDGTVTPLSVSFLVAGVAALVMSRWAREVVPKSEETVGGDR